MTFVFIDESGQFAKYNNDQYFVVGSFTIGTPRRTEKQFKVWQKTRFPKKMRHQPEIKFSEVKIGDDLRLKTLKFIASLDVRIHYVYLLRKNIPEEYIQKNQLQSGLLYTNVIGELLEMYLPVTDCNFCVYCDERHLKGIKKSEFKNILKARLAPQLPQNCLCQIDMFDSCGHPNIQIADWIVGSLWSYLEKKPLGEDFFRILKNNTIQIDGKELFKQ